MVPPVVGEVAPPEALAEAAPPPQDAANHVQPAVSDPGQAEANPEVLLLQSSLFLL